MNEILLCIELYIPFIKLYIKSDKIGSLIDQY